MSSIRRLITASRYLKIFLLFLVRAMILVMFIFILTLLSFFLFFFFQAEDGIRDKLVTGVQTCALPISDDVDALLDETFIFIARILVAHGGDRFRKLLMNFHFVAGLTLLGDVINDALDLLDRKSVV